MDNELSSVTKLAAQFGLLDDMKSKWETSLRPGIDLAATLLNIHSARLSLQPETMILSEPLALLGFGIPCLTFADLWSLQGPFSCKFWLWPCPCSWRFNISYAMLTGDPFPIVLMHSPILGLCVDSLVRVPFQNYCQSHCQLGKFFCTANCRSFGNPAGSGPTCLTWFWMACCWTEERSPVRLSWRPGNLVNVAEFHMLTLQLCD